MLSDPRNSGDNRNNSSVREETDEELMSPIPRIFNVITDKIGLNYPETGQLARKINNDTWGIRYDKLLSSQGYDTGKRVLKCLSVAQWLKQTKIAENNTVATFIDGHYFYNSINRQNLFVDFAKLRYFKILSQPINYYSLYKDTDPNVHKLYTLLRKENYNLQIKPLEDNKLAELQMRREILEQQILQTQQVQIHQLEELTAIEREACSIKSQTTIIPEMATDIMIAAYDSDPMANNVLIFAQDNFLAPFLNKLRSNTIKLTLGIARGQTVSNYYLNQFDYLVEIVDLMQTAGCLRPRRERF